MNFQGALVGHQNLVAIDGILNSKKICVRESDSAVHARTSQKKRKQR